MRSSAAAAGDLEHLAADGDLDELAADADLDELAADGHLEDLGKSEKRCTEMHQTRATKISNSSGFFSCTIKNIAAIGQRSIRPVIQNRTQLIISIQSADRMVV